MEANFTDADHNVDLDHLFQVTNVYLAPQYVEPVNLNQTIVLHVMVNLK